MLIRTMRLEDMESLAEVYYQFENESSDVERMRETFKRLEKDDNYILICAVDGDRVVGSVTGTVVQELYKKCQPFLVAENVIVHSDYHGKGVGKLMFRELERRGKEKGCIQILLVSDTKRVGAHRFYEALGFPADANKGYKKKF